VRKRTLANLTRLPPETIEILKRALRGEKLVPADHAFAIERSMPHGHVKAVLGTIRKIGLDTIIASRRSRRRDLVVAMIAERLLHPGSKLATTRSWRNTTLAEELAVADADEDELYSHLMYPDVFAAFTKFGREYGDVSVLPTPAFFSAHAVRCLHP